MAYGGYRRKYRKRGFSRRPNRYSGYGRKARVTRRLLPNPTSQVERKEQIMDLSTGTAFGYDSIGITLCNGVSTGTSYQDRIGMKANWKYFVFRGEIIAQAGLPCNYCIRLVVDKQPNGTVIPVVGAAGTGRYLATASGTQARPHDMIDFRNKMRYVTLWEQSGVMNATILTLPERRWVEKFVKLNFQTQYNNTTSGIASISSNSLYLIFLSDTTVANGPSMFWTAKSVFTDE